MVFIQNGTYVIAIIARADANKTTLDYFPGFQHDTGGVNHAQFLEFLSLFGRGYYA